MRPLVPVRMPVRYGTVQERGARDRERTPSTHACRPPWCCVGGADSETVWMARRRAHLEGERVQVPVVAAAVEHGPQKAACRAPMPTRLHWADASEEIEVWCAHGENTRSGGAGARDAATRGQTGMYAGCPGGCGLRVFACPESTGAAERWIAIRDSPLNFQWASGLHCFAASRQRTGQRAAAESADQLPLFLLVRRARPALAAPRCPCAESSRRHADSSGMFSAPGLQKRARG